MRSTGRSGLFLHNLADYFSMTKPAIASLNVFVGLATMLLAVGLHAVTANSLLLLGVAGFLSAAGAGALNCFIERRIDFQMNRTRHRPLPSGRVSANAAFSFGLVLSVSGVALAAFFLNALTASFIALGVFWFSSLAFLSTKVKRALGVGPSLKPETWHLSPPFSGSVLV